ncbi:hypothetical protein BDK51DRAFT_29744 [Blyttiomyces helicus]|uniref:Replication origin-binding protein domain-containing protein n=1 Tax=Blyttiomyces helicus TaxID=388810 RepID=A0A4P9WGI6_9FUNG|nr:hypothetical protein BDK51DRAFT_29744 [Blyttiomyces helicus]|eukprot:RKO90150.1 hypothetical protein BDK51DRAFT_29744 [Blyttiomyces helicus]
MSAMVCWGIGAALHKAIRKIQSTERSEENDELNRIAFSFFADWSSNSSKSEEWMVKKTYIGTSWENPYPHDNQLFEKSPMGTGKSFPVAQRIISSKPSCVICLSPRQSFASNFVGNLNANLEGQLNESGKPIHFKNYSEFLEKDDFTNWWRHPYLVIQMESLWKIDNGHFMPYDLLHHADTDSALFEEKSFGRKSDFTKLGKTSKQCIYMDVFLSRRTLDVTNSIVPFTASNALVRIKKLAMPSKNAIKYKNGNHFQTGLLNRLKIGTRIIVFWCSKDKVVEFEKSIKEKAPEVCTKIHHADADSTLDKDLTDVNESWKDLDCVMYTSKVTVGVNFTSPEHFSAMSVYGFSL